MYEYIVSNIIWLFIGLVVGVIISIICNDKINHLNLRWKLHRGKAVKGLIVKGYFIDIDKRSFDKAYISGDDIFNRTSDDKFRMNFELKLPFEDISEDSMPIEKSEDIIRQAYYNKHKIRVENRQMYPMNGISTKRNKIFLIPELDYKL